VLKNRLVYSLLSDYLLTDFNLVRLVTFRIVFVITQLKIASEFN